MMSDKVKLNVLGVLRSRETETQLQTAFGKVENAKLETRVVDMQSAGTDIGDVNGSNVLFLDVKLGGGVGAEMIGKIVDKYSGRIPILASSPDPTVDGIRQLMRLGVVDFLPQPISHAELEAALALANRHQMPVVTSTKPAGMVISFLNARGGLGATTVAIQTASSLTNGGERNGRVCLMDLDLQFGSVALYLDLRSQNGLDDIIEASSGMGGSFLRGVMTRHEATGLDVLAAPGKLLSFDSVTPELVNRLVNIARDEYEFAVMDLPHTWSAWTCEALIASDRIVIVTQLTVAAIRETRRQIDTIRDEGIATDNVRVFLNRHDSRWGDGIRVKEAEKVLGRRFDHFISNDYKTVRRALDCGVPLTDVKSRCVVEKQVRKWVAQLISEKSSNRQEPVLTHRG